MHGLFNRAIHYFLRDTGGEAAWRRIADAAGLPPEGFEAVLDYHDAVTDRMLRAGGSELRKPRDVLLEDLGIYLVSHPNVEPVRRLLRFGGANFVDFLHSIDELPCRAKLAVPDLVLPKITLREIGPAHYLLSCRSSIGGFGHVLAGMVRSIADDYGTLVLLDHEVTDAGTERLQIEILQCSFAPARPFQLVPAGPT